MDMRLFYVALAAAVLTGFLADWYFNGQHEEKAAARAAAERSMDNAPMRGIDDVDETKTKKKTRKVEQPEATFENDSDDTGVESDD